MPDPERPRVGAEFFYGTILQSAMRRESTAQLWDNIRSFAERAQVQYPADMFAQVNRLRANASSVGLAARNLARSSPSDAITSAVIGRPLYARPQSSFEALPQWEARVELVLEAGGASQRQWVTVQYGSDRPDTIGALMEDLDGYAVDFADHYEGRLIGVGSVLLNQI